MPSSRLRLALLACLLVGLAVAAAPAAAGTPDYDPATPWVGMTVTASHGEITAGETYDLRRADELSGGEIHGSQFVEELVAEADGELRIETTDLDAGNYFITGPGLASRGDVPASDTFELREQDLGVGFGDDDAVDESDDTDATDDEADPATNDTDTTDDATEPTTNDTEPARYYGTVTINGEPAPIGTTIEAEVDGEVRGSITVETAGSYGGPNASDKQLTLTGSPASENRTVAFYITPPDGDRLAADQTDAWEPTTRSEITLTDDTEADSAESTTNATDTATNDSETAVTDTAPGFGVVVAVVALLVVALSSRRQSA